MKLYIDTSKVDFVTIKLNEEEFIASSRKDKSQMLLPFIIEKLMERKKTLRDINSIELNSGPGSFTGLRVGASIAQTLAYALDVTVNGENLDKVHFIKLHY